MVLHMLWAVALAACLALTCWSQGRLPDLRDHPERTVARLSPKVLRALAFGHTQTLADGLYLQAVSLWGQYSQAPTQYLDLGPILQRTVALDPSYEGAYLLAGTALTLQGMDTAQGLALLREGATRFPDNWRLLFLYGFNAYDLQHDPEAAAQALTAAALLPDAPAHLPMLAASISSKAHHIDLAIAMLETLLQATHDETEHNNYRQRIASLRAQQQSAQGSPP